jgi:hypothetical protein
MDPDQLRLLLDIDARYAGELECPAGFDRVAALDEVHRLLPLLGEATGRRFDLDDSAQDASFFAELVTHDIVTDARGDRATEILLAVRFSSFARLCTAWSAPANPPPPGLVAQVADVVRAHGYVFIDSDGLDGPYTGNARWKISWRSRFFDYV